MTRIGDENTIPWFLLNGADGVTPETGDVDGSGGPEKLPGNDPSIDEQRVRGVVQGAAKLLEARAKFAQDLSDVSRDDARLAEHDLVARVNGLVHSDTPMPQDMRDELLGVTANKPDEKRGNDPQKPEVKNKPAPDNDQSPGVKDNEEDGAEDDPDKPPLTDGEIWAIIVKLIVDVKENFLNIFGEAAAKYLDFGKALTDIISKLSSWITSKGDGKEVELDVGALRGELEKLLAKYKLPSKDAVLWPKQKEGKDGEIEGGSKEDAQKWAKELGLPESSVVEQPPGSGKYVVVVDTTPIQKMIDTLPKDDKNGKAKMTTQQLEIWRTGFTGQENLVKTALQSMSQRFTTANATNETLVKLLSGSIVSMAEAFKGFNR
ncbi:IpaD/SipD/SspD family type III secretion system needle tip protein [Pandoraea anhela]|uniref:Translocator protein BipD n=1 Tax=Pandoraea anhela TaxID=2508295 RepID=A0A5E4SS43_9BURK|nr:IpaD/SipD/SspD family type III secretion system needle tip protein [Pandoraea anhela]VVD77124.1 Cell invasion protein SipD [Pandoraea anhela]